MNLNERILDESEIVKDEQLPKGILARVRRTICELDKKNANKRVYTREVWERVLSDKEFQRKLKNRQVLGDAEHPAETQLKLSPNSTSHVVSKMWIDEKNNVVKADFDLLPTDAGKFIHVLLEAGVKVGASTRAEGELEEAVDESGEKYSRVKPDSYRFCTVDHTADPSASNTEPESIIRAVRKGYENKEIGKAVACALLEMAGGEDAKKLEEAIKADKQHSGCKSSIDNKKCANCKHANESVRNTFEASGKKLSYRPKKYQSSTYKNTAEGAIAALAASYDNKGVAKRWAVRDPQVDGVWLVITQYKDGKETHGDLPGWDADVLYLNGEYTDFETADNTKSVIQKYAPYHVRDLAIKETVVDEGKKVEAFKKWLVSEHGMHAADFDDLDKPEQDKLMDEFDKKYEKNESKTEVAANKELEIYEALASWFRGAMSKDQLAKSVTPALVEAKLSDDFVDVFIRDVNEEYDREQAKQDAKRNAWKVMMSDIPVVGSWYYYMDTGILEFKPSRADLLQDPWFSRVPPYRFGFLAEDNGIRYAIVRLAKPALTKQQLAVLLDELGKRGGKKVDLVVQEDGKVLMESWVMDYYAHAYAAANGDRRKQFIAECIVNMAVHSPRTLGSDKFVMEESKTHDRYEELKKEIDAMFNQMEAETDPKKKHEIEMKREALRQEKMDIEDHWKELGRESVTEGKKVEAFKSWLQKEHSMDRNAFYELSEDEQTKLMQDFEKTFKFKPVGDAEVREKIVKKGNKVRESKMGDASSLQKLKKEAYAYFDSVKIVPTPEEIVDFVANALEDDLGIEISMAEYRSLAKKLGMQVDEANTASKYLSGLREKKLSENQVPVMATDDARKLLGKILDYLLVADDPAYNKIVGFKKQIEKLPVSADRENLIKWFNVEFRPDWDPRLGGTEKTAWDYYDKFDESKITESTEIYCPWCDEMIPKTVKTQDGKIVCPNCQYDFSKDTDESKMDEAAPKFKKCPACGKGVEEDEAKCKNCGADQIKDSKVTATDAVKESLYMLADDSQKDPMYDEDKKVYTVAYLKDGQRVVAVFKDKEKATYFFDKVKARQNPNESRVNEVSFSDLDSILSKGKDLTLEELIAAVKLSMAEEFSATELYKKIAASTDNEMAKKVMQSVADEESVHAGEFRKLLATLDPKEEDLQKQGEKEVASESKIRVLHKIMEKLGSADMYESREELLSCVLNESAVDAGVSQYARSVFEVVSPEEIKKYIKLSPNAYDDKNHTVATWWFNPENGYLQYKKGFLEMTDKAFDVIPDSGMYGGRVLKTGNVHFLLVYTNNKQIKEVEFNNLRSAVEKALGDKLVAAVTSEKQVLWEKWMHDWHKESKTDLESVSRYCNIVQRISFPAISEHVYVLKESLLKVGDKVKYKGKELTVKAIDLEDYLVELDLGDGKSVTVTPEEIEDFMITKEAKGQWSVQHAYNDKYNKKFASKEDAVAHAKSFRKGKNYDGNYYVIDPSGKMLDESVDPKVISEYKKSMAVGDEAEIPTGNAQLVYSVEGTVGEKFRVDREGTMLPKGEYEILGKDTDAGHSGPWGTFSYLKVRKIAESKIEEQDNKTIKQKFLLGFAQAAGIPVADAAAAWEKYKKGISQEDEDDVVSGGYESGKVEGDNYKSLQRHPKQAESPSRKADDGPNYEKDNHESKVTEAADAVAVGEELNAIIAKYVGVNTELEDAILQMLKIKGVVESAPVRKKQDPYMPSKAGAVPAQQKREAVMSSVTLQAASEEYAKLEARLKELEECYASDMMGMTAKTVAAQEAHSRVSAKLSKAQTELSEMVQTLRNTEKESLRVIQELKQSHERKLSTLEESKKKELSKMADAHQSELDALVAEHKKQMLHKYIECRVKFSGLALPEPVRALLEQCASEERVEDVLEQYRRMIREGVHFTAASLTIIDGKSQPKSAFQSMFESAASGMIGARK